MAKEIQIANFLKMNPQIPQYSEKNQNYLIAGVNPISYLDDGTQEEQIAPLAASLDWSEIKTPVILASYSESYQDSFDTIYGASSVVFIGESFTNVNSATLSGAKFYLKKAGTPTGNATAKIYAHSGTFHTTGIPTGAALATSDSFNVATLTTSFALISFTFSGANAITLSAGTNYFIVITYAGGDISNNIIIGEDNTSPTALGNLAYSPDGSSWSYQTTYAICFYVYGSTSSGSLDGNIVHMIPSTEGTYSIYAITDTTKVYGITTTSITDLGYPSGSAVANTGGYLAIGGGGTTNSGYLFVTVSSAAAVYKMTLPSGAWSSFGSMQTAVGVHIMEPFLDFIALRDGTTSFYQGGVVKKIDVTAFTISTGIDLGAGWGIYQMRNFNNKYLAIAGGKTGIGSSGYPQNYIFLWDGVSSRYNYSVKVPGKFIDMKVIDTTLYVAVEVSDNKTCVYKLVSTSLRKVFTTQYSTIRTVGPNAPITCSLFDFKSYLGIQLDQTTDMTVPVLIYGDDEIGSIEFIHTYNKLFDYICPGYDGNIFADVSVLGSSSNVYYLPTTGNYQNILYKSQWIPVNNLKAIDIYHDSVPVSGTDAINVTIYGQGEDIITGASTTVLDSITPTNYLTVKRTRLDVKGFTGSQVKIQLSTVNSTWRPIIRAISLITE